MAIEAELGQLHIHGAFTSVPVAMVGDNLLLSTTWVFTRRDLVDHTYICNKNSMNAPTVDPEIVVRIIIALRDQ